MSTFISLLILACGPLLIGCDRPDLVQGQPRDSSKQVVTAGQIDDQLIGSPDAKASTTLQRGQRNFDFSFLHADHFAVVMMDVAKIYNNPGLKEFNWQRLTRLLQSYVGFKNAHPKKLSAVWILCDREIADADKEEGAKESDFVIFVIDFLSPLDQKEFAKALKTRAATEQNDSSDRWRSEVRVRSDRQIAIGTAVMLDKLEESQFAGEVADSISRLGADVDVSLSVSFEPVRGALKGVMAMATQFLGEDMKPLLRLPTTAHLFNATLSLSSDQLLVTDLKMSSSDAATQVTEVWGKLLDPANIGQLLTLLSIQFGRQKKMFELKSLPIVNRVSRQIEASRLYQVRSEGATIKSLFTRPRDFERLLGAGVDDVERSLALINRLKRMREVADALKSYEEVHGHLPAATYRAQTDEKTVGFSWRSELLPLLGRQNIFNKIDFKQAWDSKSNNRLQSYFVPALHDRRGLQPMAVMFPVNPKWMFPDRNSQPKLSSIRDVADQTAIAVEVRVPPTFQYFKPVDLTLDDISLWGREDEAGVVFIDANFDVRVVKKSEENLKSILSIDGGQRLGRSDFIDVLGFSNH